MSPLIHYEKTVAGASSWRLFSLTLNDQILDKKAMMNPIGMSGPAVQSFLGGDLSAQLKSMVVVLRGFQ